MLQCLRTETTASLAQMACLSSLLQLQSGINGLPAADLISTKMNNKSGKVMKSVYSWLSKVSCSTTSLAFVALLPKSTVHHPPSLSLGLSQFPSDKREACFDDHTNQLHSYTCSTKACNPYIVPIHKEKQKHKQAYCIAQVHFDSFSTHWLIIS